MMVVMVMVVMMMMMMGMGRSRHSRISFINLNFSAHKSNFELM